ncbi:universal stress protein [Oceanisphaera pacifica]|uniref:Universal stress protein n=1 Tax=Oceanisphaera pacifica TaxID=2818389 RepID=A0ABS3NDA1_9GAMM|nr:universal stress protein [Oceanisphaera pacifica]MBO1518515.1 universal stress protein [Oceanisphaera pacifica]
MYTSLLVAVDGSKQSEKALTLACYLAQSNQAKIHIVHAPEVLQHPAIMTWGLGAVSLESSREELAAMSSKLVEHAVSVAKEQGINQVEGHVIYGEPTLAIIKQADNLGVDVIVMGCRGLGNLSGLVMGSVSHKVSHSAQCGVITIR